MAVGQVNENKRRPESLRYRIGQERIEPKLEWKPSNLVLACRGLAEGSRWAWLMGPECVDVQPVILSASRGEGGTRADFRG